MAIKQKIVEVGKRTYARARKSKEVREMERAAKAQAAEFLREKLADMPIAGIATVLLKRAKDVKAIRGADGTNVMPPDTRDVVIKEGASSAVSSSASMYVYRPPRKRRYEGVDYVQLTRSSGTFDAGAGTQNRRDISILDIRPPLNDVSSDKYTNLSLKKAFDDYLLAKNQSITPSSGTPTDSVLNIEQSAVHLKTLSAELSMTNVNTTTAVIDLWEVIPKFTVGPATYSNSGYATGYMSPSWCWAQGLSNDAGNTATDTPMLENLLTSGTVGSKPTDSLNFARTWKVVKHVKINLTGGSTHNHKMVYALNQTVPYQEYAQASTQGGKASGYMPTFLMNIKGAPSQSNPLGSASEIAFNATMRMDYSGYMSGDARAIVFDSTT